MKLVDLNDIIKDLGEKWSSELFLKSLKLCGIPWTYEYCNINTLEPEMWIHAIKHNMDKDKLVVLWLTISHTLKDCAGPRCVCIIFHDVEYETILHAAKRIFKMKLFL
ncbi:MAG TPA: hypothetical protein VII94_03925 [Candidatus Saccharimonadales bacterium]